VRLYKELSDVERAFASLKDIIDMRPIYHRTRPPGAGAHLHRRADVPAASCDRKELKAQRLDLSATEALTALKSVRVVDIDLGDGATKRSLTHGSQRAATVLRALGITKLDPPTSPQQGETVM